MKQAKSVSSDNTKQLLAMIERSEFAVKHHQKKSKKELAKANELISQAQARFK